jgi:4-amino-4-deoxy-L-arabinose transferase-like glycosyltransferase
MPDTTNTNWSRHFWILLAVATAIRMALAAVIPISGDEAYYWDCSKHLDWTYFDQPPIAIWIIVPFRILFGDVFLAVRMPAILASLGIGLCLPGLTRRLGGSMKDAFFAYLWMSAMPFFILGSFYESTDIMMAAFYLATTWAAVTIAQGETRGWWGFGLAIGLGFLSKFPVVVVLPALIPALAQKDVRAHLKSATPWLAALMAFGLTLPVWIWGARNNWDNVRFQVEGRHEIAGLTAKFVGEFLGANLLLAGPALFIAVAIAWWRGWKKKDPAWKVALVAAAMPLIFFGLFSLRQRVGGHWAAPGLLVAIVLFALMSGNRPRKKLAWASGLYGGGLSVLVVLIVLLPDSIMDREWTYPGRPERISTKKLAQIVGNRELATHLAAIRRPDELVGSESYSTVHLTRFYTRGEFPMTVIRIADGEHGLASLYWYPASEFAGRDMLVVTKPRYDRSYLEPLFDSVEELPPLEIERGGEVVRSFRIYRGRGIRGPLDVFSRVASR